MNLKRWFLMGLVPSVAALGTIGIREAWPRKNSSILQCQSSIELGDRERGEVVVSQFKVKNLGDALLVLDNFQTSCSCAGVEHSENGQYRQVQSVKLGPDQETDLTVRLAVGAPHGERQQVSVVFRTNDQTRPIHEIQVVVSRVKGGVFALPKAVVFGSVPVGQTATRLIDLYDVGERGRTIATVRSTRPSRFDVRLIPLGKNQAPVVHPTAGNLIARLEIVALTQQHGKLDGAIEVRLSGEERKPDVIPVVGEVVRPLECTPETLVLPRRMGKAYVYEGEVLLFNRDGKPIMVSVDALPPGFSAEARAVRGRLDQALLSMKCEEGRAFLPSMNSRLQVSVRIACEGAELTEVVPILIRERPE